MLVIGALGVPVRLSRLYLGSQRPVFIVISVNHARQRSLTVARLFIGSQLKQLPNRLCAHRVPKEVDRTQYAIQLPKNLLAIMEKMRSAMIAVPIRASFIPRVLSCNGASLTFPNAIVTELITTAMGFRMTTLEETEHVIRVIAVLTYFSSAFTRSVHSNEMETWIG